MKEQREYEMSTIRKNDFEKTEGERVRVRNSIQTKKGKKNSTLK